MSSQPLLHSKAHEINIPRNSLSFFDLRSYIIVSKSSTDFLFSPSLYKRDDVQNESPQGSPHDPVVKNSPANSGDTDSNPDLGRSPLP